MAFSTQRVESDGTLVQIGVSLEYFDRSEISVLIDGILSPPGPDAPWHWVGETEKTIEFDEPVAEGVEIMLRRSTNMDAVRHSFEGGAQFKNRTMDENFTQALRIAQEAKEGGTLSDIFLDLNMHGFQIKNIGTPTEDADAVSLGYYRADALGASQARVAAEAARNAAVTAQNNAQMAATTSATNRDLARDWAIKLDGPVSGTERSAKYHAQQAATSAASASADRTQTGLDRVQTGNDRTAAAASAAAAQTAETNAAASAASIDPANLIHTTGDETKSGVLTFEDSPIFQQPPEFPQEVIDEYQWLGTPIGSTIELRTDLAGVQFPPTDNPKFRYIVLTAAHAYNTGVLTSESVTGTSPLIVATAVVNLSGSPMNGATVYLENTMRTFSRAGSSGLLQNDAMQGHVHPMGLNTIAAGGASGNGIVTNGTRNTAGPASDGTNGTPRIGNETRPRNIGKTLFMRIM